MNEKQDIYRSSEKDEKQAVEQNSVDMKVPDYRARTRRSSLGFVLLMLAVLGIAVWLIVAKDEDDTPAPMPPPEAGRDPLLDMDNDRFMESMLVAPAITNFPDVPPRTADEPPPVLDPQRTARAMGEMRLANKYLQAKEWDSAELHARRALEIWPDMNKAMRLLGVIYTQRGQFDQAIVVMERALKTDPFNAETFNTLATVYMHRGEMAKAEELLLSALEIRPDYMVGYYNLGLLYIAAGQYESSIDVLYRAAEGIPEDPTIRNKLAVALLRVGRYDEARHNLDLLIRAMPEMAPAYFNMAITFALAQQHTEALDWIRKGSEHCSPVMLQRFLGDHDFDSLRGHPAFQALQRELYPHLPDIPMR